MINVIESWRFLKFNGITWMVKFSQQSSKSYGQFYEDVTNWIKCNHWEKKFIKYLCPSGKLEIVDINDGNKLIIFKIKLEDTNIFNTNVLELHF